MSALPGQAQAIRFVHTSLQICAYYLGWVLSRDFTLVSTTEHDISGVFPVCITQHARYPPSGSKSTMEEYLSLGKTRIDQEYCGRVYVPLREEAALDGSTYSLTTWFIRRPYRLIPPYVCSRSNPLILPLL